MNYAGLAPLRPLFGTFCQTYTELSAGTGKIQSSDKLALKNSCVYGH